MGLVHKPTSFNSADGSGMGTIADEVAGTTTRSLYRTGDFNLQYPNNLDTSPEYGKNRVVFFINVVSNSKINKESGGGSMDARTLTTDLPPSEFGKQAAENIKELIFDISKSLGVGINIAGPKKRLQAAISLYIPNTLQTSYSTMWGEEDLATGEFVDELLGGAKNTLNAMKGDGPAMGAAADVAQTIGAKTIRETIAGMSYVQKATQTTPGNAKAEQLFQGVDFRTFTFDYQFTPKTVEEAKTVLSIIRLFRHHMLPEFADKSSFLYIYPSEFEIKYYKNDKENPYIEKQMTAVLTNMTVNYTPTGQFTTFGGELDGMPSHINLTLTFKELGLLSKETSPFDKVGL